MAYLLPLLFLTIQIFTYSPSTTVSAEDCDVSESGSELWNTYYSCIISDQLSNVANQLSEESSIASQLPPRTGASFTGAHFLGNSIRGKKLGIAALVCEGCLQYLKEVYSYSNCQLETALALMAGSQSLAASSAEFQDQINEDFSTKFIDTVSCLFLEKWGGTDDCTDKDYFYRTVDGKCNNLLFTDWGASVRPFRRYLPADYADGIEKPRVASDGSELPSARSVSLLIHSDNGSNTNHFMTAMHFTFGQFLDHDLTKTAVSKLAIQDSYGIVELVDVDCGADGCETDGPGQENCFPIVVPENDPHFNSCLPFVRSQGVMRSDCVPGPREFLNQLSSWLDSGSVYGSTQEENDKVRDHDDSSRGRLQVKGNPHHPGFKPLLPTDENNPDCRNVNPDDQCFVAGDERVNEQIGLMTMHTIFQRAHNDIEEKLHAINPNWSGEMLYEQSRRILIAARQHIIFNEYLPPLLGLDNMKKYGLLPLKTGNFEGYNVNTNPDVSVGFATAAFRMGHTMVTNMIETCDYDYNTMAQMPFSSIQNRPATLYGPDLQAGDPSGPDSIMHGLACQRAMKVDAFLVPQIQHFLFSESPPDEPGIDLASLNIQRGRDHGMPSYLAWRRFCGLSDATTFAELDDMSDDSKEKFEQLYKDVEDIDLFPGGLSEIPENLAALGPTFSCIIAQTFRNLKEGDRFYYENSGIGSFTEAQLTEIRKYTMARILCDNLDGMIDVQKFVLMIPLEEALANTDTRDLDIYYQLIDLYFGDDNHRRPCSEIPEPDFSNWRDFGFGQFPHPL